MERCYLGSINALIPVLPQAIGLIQRSESEWDCGSGLPDLLRFWLRAQCCVGESILSWAGHSINIAQGTQAGEQAGRHAGSQADKSKSIRMVAFNFLSTDSPRMSTA